MTSVRSIRVQQWASYGAEQTLPLPETGLVVISGKNGEGKSVLVEAVSFALWNKSIRDKGKGAWRDLKEPSRVAVTLASGAEVIREYARGSSARVTIMQGGKPSRYGTATKAQVELDALVGDFNTWRTACVFHAGSAAAKFASATDSERKRLIDALMGVDVFDAASKAVRADLRTAEHKLDSARRTAETSHAGVESLTARLQDARASLAAWQIPPEPAPVAQASADVGELRAQLTEVAGQLEQFKSALAQRQSELAAAQQRRAVLGEQLRTFALRAGMLGGQPSCPTCLGPVDGDVLERALLGRDGVEREISSLDAASVALGELLRGQQQELAEMLRKRESLRAQIARAEAVVSQAEREHKAWVSSCTRVYAERARVEKLVKQLGADLARLDERLDESTFEVEDLSTDAAELRAADKALGVTGIRATVTGDLLGSIEQLSNYWLGLIDERLGVQLSAFRELSDGRQRDEIELRLTGAGGGSYYDASTGQQRRVDLAVMLALAEVVGGDTSRQRSTLFFDEVFGALDTDACRATARVLRELAEDHCVVVLTHVDQLAEDLGADVHVRISGGKMQVKA